MTSVPGPCIQWALDANLEAVFCKVICEKLEWYPIVSLSGKNGARMTYLVIDELDTENIRQEEDDFVLWIVHSRGGNVASDTANGFKFA
jgi:hypothetical protein